MVDRGRTPDILDHGDPVPPGKAPEPDAVNWLGEAMKLVFVETNPSCGGAGISGDPSPMV